MGIKKKQTEASGIIKDKLFSCINWTFLFLLFGTSILSYGQDNNAIAQSYFIKAEDAFNNENFLYCHELLDKASDALGHDNSKILYLKILSAYDAIQKQSDFKYFNEIKKELADFFTLTDSKTYPEEKYLQIVAVKEEVDKWENPFRKIPSTSITDINGQKIKTAELSNNGKPFIISFWATWCKPCINEFNAIGKVYADWQKETGVKLIAVSIDHASSSQNILPMMKSNAWDYEVLFDPDQVFSKALQVTVIPATLLIDGKGEIIWQHTSFHEGDEIDLIERVRRLKSEQ